ncbi:MAG: CoA-binding protein, partial [Deltaproteobacteria bacterium]|nr:CoA-binding protein [Deltaproteobacteria bacterium]
MDAKRAIRSLLYPRSIAVVGASEAADKFSGRVLKHLLKSGFKGAIFPINPKRSEVQGVPCFARVRDIAGSVNVAVMVVPNRYLFESLEDCREKGVDVALVLNSGFAEAGEEGKRLQEKLTLFAEESGIRVCGPNSNGYVNILERVVVGTSGAFDRPDFIAGNVAFLVQSGGIAGALLDLAQEKRIGLSYCISLGNEADLGTTDFVDYLADDPHTQVIAMFVEGLRDGRRFLSAAERAIEKGKSLVVFKVGKSLKGQEAARAHTGKLAGSAQVWSEALRRAGVGQVADLDDLVGASGLLSRFPSPNGKNLAILTLSGGQGVILADLCESHSVHLPPPSPETAKELRELLPDFAAFSNPIDLTGQASASPEVLDRVLAKLAEDPTFDVLLLVLVASPVAARLWTERIVSVAQKIPRPLIVLWSGGRGLDGWRDRLQESGVPVFTQASVCVRALSAFLSAGKTAEKTVKTVSLDRNRAEKAREFLRARRG